jgi:predicted transcriptional regulator
MKTKDVIQQIKTKTGLTNYLLAKQLGVPISTLYHVANGDNDISFGTLTE